MIIFWVVCISGLISWGIWFLYHRIRESLVVRDIISDRSLHWQSIERIVLSVAGGAAFLMLFAVASLLTASRGDDFSVAYKSISAQDVSGMPIEEDERPNDAGSNGTRYADNSRVPEDRYKNPETAGTPAENRAVRTMGRGKIYVSRNFIASLKGQVGQRTVLIDVVCRGGKVQGRFYDDSLLCDGAVTGSITVKGHARLVLQCDGQNNTDVLTGVYDNAIFSGTAASSAGVSPFPFMLKRIER